MHPNEVLKMLQDIQESLCDLAIENANQSERIREAKMSVRKNIMAITIEMDKMMDEMRKDHHAA